MKKVYDILVLYGHIPLIAERVEKEKACILKLKSKLRVVSGFSNSQVAFSTWIFGLK